MVFDKKLRKSIAGLKKMPTFAPAIEREILETPRMARSSIG